MLTIERLKRWLLALAAIGSLAGCSALPAASAQTADVPWCPAASGADKDALKRRLSDFLRSYPREKVVGNDFERLVDPVGLDQRDHVFDWLAGTGSDEVVVVGYGCSDDDEDGKGLMVRLAFPSHRHSWWGAAIAYEADDLSDAKLFLFRIYPEPKFP